jgi:predicted phage gp36 major capsid-like protein
VLQGERDKALAELTIAKGERDEMGAILAQVDSKVDEILGSSELTPEPPNEEQQQELEECRKALQQTKAELEHTKDELQRAEVRLRTQASKMRRQATQAAGQDW